MNKKLLIIIGTLVIAVVLFGIYIYIYYYKPVIPETVKEKAEREISQVKVVSQYTRVNDGEVIGRNVSDVIRILKETKTEFIFLGFWWTGPLPESPETAPSRLAVKGYTYTQVKDAIAQIKKEMPDVIFCSGFPVYGKPDLTNPDDYNYVLREVKREIDMGSDAIWLDMLFHQTNHLIEETGDPHDPQVREAYKAASRLVDDIHQYGYSKYGKYIYVGTWGAYYQLPYPAEEMPNMDFVTVKPTIEEINTGKFNPDWNKRASEMRGKLGDIPIFVLLDYSSSTRTPLGVFSQIKTTEQQRELLKKLDRFFQGLGMNWVYLIHGGDMGEEAEILSYGKYRIYDSLAPEFETYETIKELAQNKTKR